MFTDAHSIIFSALIQYFCLLHLKTTHVHTYRAALRQSKSTPHMLLGTTTTPSTSTSYQKLPRTVSSSSSSASQLPLATQQLAVTAALSAQAQAQRQHCALRPLLAAEDTSYCGEITPSRFRHCLGLAGVRLTGAELLAVETVFSGSKWSGSFDWRAFCDTAEGVTGTTGGACTNCDDVDCTGNNCEQQQCVHTAPKLKLALPQLVTSATATTVTAAAGNATNSNAVAAVQAQHTWEEQALLLKLRQALRDGGVTELTSMCYKNDRANTGYVTETQFFAHLAATASTGLNMMHIGPHARAMLCKLLVVKRGTELAGVVNYKHFAASME
jgi:hypothetical protein